MSPLVPRITLNATVLIVEDDLVTLHNIQRYLSPFFKKVWACESATQAWECYETYRPDVIVSDIEMPHTNGLDFIRKIRKDDYASLVFIVTGFPKEAYLLEAIPLKLEAFLIKPLTSSKLESIVETCQRTFLKHDTFFDEQETLSYSYSRKSLVTYEGEITLTHLEIIILETLLSAKNTILSYMQLENALGLENSFSRNSLRVSISHLRKKHPLICIENHPEKGYMLRC